MIPPQTKWIAIGAGMIAILSLGLADIFAPSSLADWLTTFGATLVSAALAVAGGIWLFHYQTNIRDEREHDRMQTMTAAEAKLNLDILEERPAVIQHAITGKPLAKQAVVLVQLPLKALEDLIHSGHEDPEVSSELMRLAAHVRAHNTDVALLLGGRNGAVTRASIQQMTADLHQRQRVLKDRYKDLLNRLEKAGIKPPSEAEGKARPRKRGRV